MMNNVLNLIFLGVLFLLLGCDPDSRFISGQFDDQRKLISQSDLYIANYFVNEEEVKIIVEDLLNTSDNRSDEFPMLDFLMIRVDMNNNNLPDNNLDKAYSISSVGNSCMQFILNDGAASTGCMEEFGFHYEVDFRASENNNEAHIIYELLIRRENLFTNSEDLGLIFVLNGDDAGGSIPFSFTPMFKETIEFSL